MDKQGISKYSFVNEIAPVLRDSEQIREAHRLFDTKVDAETIKAFLIHLTISTFGHSKESDIVLMSWGLLKGYENLSTVTARRIKYMTESGYKSKSKTASKRTPEARSKDFIRKEDKLYEKLYQTYSDNQNETEFIKAAKDFYLEPIPGEPKMHRVKPPEPSYVNLSETWNTISNKKQDKNQADLKCPIDIENPETLPKKALRIISEMEPFIAEGFERLCSFAVKNMYPLGGSYMLISTDGMKYDVNGEYCFIDRTMETYVEYGLLSPKKEVQLSFKDYDTTTPVTGTEAFNYHLTGKPGDEAFIYNPFEKKVIMIKKKPEYPDYTLTLNCYFPTFAGESLVHRLSKKHNSRYMIELGRSLRDEIWEKCDVSVHEIIMDNDRYTDNAGVSHEMLYPGDYICEAIKHNKSCDEFLDLSHDLIDEVPRPIPREKLKVGASVVVGPFPVDW